MHVRGSITQKFRFQVLNHCFYPPPATRESADAHEEGDALPSAARRQTAERRLHAAAAVGRAHAGDGGNGERVGQCARGQGLASAGRAAESRVGEMARVRGWDADFDGGRTKYKTRNMRGQIR